MKDNFIKKALRNFFELFPESFKCIFGNCKEACGALSEEESLAEPQSLKLKLHLSICSKCWSYYQQMSHIDIKIKSWFKASHKKSKPVAASEVLPNSKSADDSLAESIINKYSS